MRQKSDSDFRFDPESSGIYLGYAADCLRLIQEQICQELTNIDKMKKFLGTGYLMTCCNAMNPALRELERIQRELEQAAGVPPDEDA